jgi:hypothetical protein
MSLFIKSPNNWHWRAGSIFFLALCFFVFFTQRLKGVKGGALREGASYAE